MKVCPVCHESFDDSARTCPNDGAQLVADALPLNFRPPPVRPGSPVEATALIDLEALQTQHERQKAAQRGQRDGQRDGQRGTRTGFRPQAEDTGNQPFSTTPSAFGSGMGSGMGSALGDAADSGPMSALGGNTSDNFDDPDPTNMLSPQERKRRQEELANQKRGRGFLADQDDERMDTRGGNGGGNGTRSPQRGSVVFAPPGAPTGQMPIVEIGDEQIESGSIPATNNSRLTQNSRRDATQASRDPKNPTPAQKSSQNTRSPVRVAMILLVVVILLAGGALYGVWYYDQHNPKVLFNSTPPGATLLIDNRDFGATPKKFRIEAGAHEVSILLEGYEDFQDVIEIPVGGKQFLFSLKAVAPPTPPVEDKPADDSALKAQIDALVAEIESLIAAGKFDEALAKIKELVKLAPDDPRIDALMQKLADAKAKAQAKNGSGNNPQNARSLYEEGVRLYSQDRLAEAKQKFQAAIRLDGRFAEPHRALARIHMRENDVEQTRYQLSRYLELGGSDADFKVRQWLKEHP